MLDGRMKGVVLHDALYGFREKRGCRTDIIQAKLLQQLAFTEQCPMYGVFLDLHKAYNAMDMGRCIKILEDCGVGSKTLRLVQRFWDAGILVCKASGCYGDPFQAWRGHGIFGHTRDDIKVSSK